MIFHTVIFILFYFLDFKPKNWEILGKCVLSIENSTILANLLGIFDTYMPLVYL